MTNRPKTEQDNEKRRRRRGPKKATPEYLEKSALFYLERYATSEENLRRNLLRKVRRSAEAHGTDPEAGAEAVEALLARFRRSGRRLDCWHPLHRMVRLLRRVYRLRRRVYRLRNGWHRQAQPQPGP